MFDIDSKIRVDVVVIGDGIGTSGATFYNIRVVLRYTISGIVGIVRMLDDSGIPYVCNAKLFYRCENSLGNIVELARAIHRERSPWFWRGAGIAEKTRKKLVDDRAHLVILPDFRIIYIFFLCQDSKL